MTSCWWTFITRRITSPLKTRWCQTVLVFDLHIIDFHNPSDTVDIQITYRPEVCNDTTAVNDLGPLSLQLHPGGRHTNLQDAVLGADKVIDGLDEGLRGMCVGEKRLVTVPPHLGHGEKGVFSMDSNISIFYGLYVEQT
uniref:peptidylprolyl isomerase n=1 Tax=Lates calcarifer TaxID=8187 RepID=A0A4W6BJX4_LATCA